MRTLLVRLYFYCYLTVAWRNYAYVFTVRGVEPYERNVLMYIADEADADGYIDSFRLARLSENSETPRRRLLQIVKQLEEDKGLVERVQRVWSKKLNQAIFIRKGEKKTGKQIPSGYRLRKDCFFPLNKVEGKLVEHSPVWILIKQRLQEQTSFAEGLFRIYIGGIRQSYYVKKTRLLCLLASSPEHASWLKDEAIKPIIAIGVDLKPPVLAVKVFTVPNPSDK